MEEYQNNCSSGNFIVTITKAFHISSCLARRALGFTFVPGSTNKGRLGEQVMSWPSDAHRVEAHKLHCTVIAQCAISLFPEEEIELAQK